MANLGDFDANAVDPNEPQQPIPAGTYLAQIVKSERKENKSNSGTHLELTFAVLDGQYKGRTVKERLNLWHSNSEAVRIAKGDLSAICRAVGVMKPRDSTALHNLPLEILVGVTNPDEKGRMYNEINGHAKRGAPAAPAAPPAQGQAPGSDQAAENQMGWLQ
jgi:hypothetical protein